jgi:hypothetical protein
MQAWAAVSLSSLFLVILTSAMSPVLDPPAGPRPAAAPQRAASTRWLLCPAPDTTASLCPVPDASQRRPEFQWLTAEVTAPAPCHEAILAGLVPVP